VSGIGLIAKEATSPSPALPAHNLITARRLFSDFSGSQVEDTLGIFALARLAARRTTWAVLNGRR
jgi:hypothetical protein